MNNNTERTLKELREQLEEAIDCLQGQGLERLMEKMNEGLEEIHSALKESRKLARLRDIRPDEKQPSLDHGDPLTRLLAGPSEGIN